MGRGEKVSAKSMPNEGSRLIQAWVNSPINPMDKSVASGAFVKAIADSNDFPLVGEI
jgi:hypothetical protein